ncbi:hypothetical protein STEG23_032869 [Scotinomys teguina]
MCYAAYPVILHLFFMACHPLIAPTRPHVSQRAIENIRVKHSFTDSSFVCCDKIGARDIVMNNRKFRKGQKASCDKH